MTEKRWSCSALVPNYGAIADGVTCGIGDSHVTLLQSIPVPLGRPAETSKSRYITVQSVPWQRDVIRHYDVIILIILMKAKIFRCRRHGSVYYAEAFYAGTPAVFWQLSVCFYWSFGPMLYFISQRPSACRRPRLHCLTITFREIRLAP